MVPTLEKGRFRKTNGKISYVLHNAFRRFKTDEDAIEFLLRDIDRPDGDYVFIANKDLPCDPQKVVDYINTKHGNLDRILQSSYWLDAIALTDGQIGIWVTNISKQSAWSFISLVREKLAPNAHANINLNRIRWTVQTLRSVLWSLIGRYPDGYTYRTHVIGDEFIIEKYV